MILQHIFSMDIAPNLFVMPLLFCVSVKAHDRDVQMEKRFWNRKIKVALQIN